MNIKMIKKDLAVTFMVNGRLDSTTSGQLEKEIMENIKDASELYLDFTELKYISSAGLRVLLIALKEMEKQGKMVLKNVNKAVMEVLFITGFAEILTIEKVAE